MSTIKDEGIAEAIEQRATEWYVLHRNGELTAGEQKQYMQWLQASPRHVEAYLSLIGLTARLPDAIGGLGVDVEALAAKIGKSQAGAEQALFPKNRNSIVKASSHAALRWSALAAAIVMTVVGGLYWSIGRQHTVQSIVVPASQQRLLTLADGSIANLNSNTRINIRYSDTQRLIELSEGQGLFKVVHDARRPFIVRSGGMDVVALGTQFDVYRRAQRMQVTVVEGKIEILRDTSTAGGKQAAPVRLVAGEQLRLVDRMHAELPLKVDPQAVTAWAHKEVSFAGARLEDVARQFTRYTGARIAIDSEELRDYRISGVFQAYDVDSFVAYLREFDRVQVARDGDDIRVTRNSGRQ